MNTAANAVAERQNQAPAPVDESTFTSMLERVIRDPAISIERLERVMAMQERILDRNAEQAFNEALNAAQSEMTPIAADSLNPQTKSKYASYAALDKAVRPIYTKHGFSLSFDSGDNPPADHVRVECMVACGGHTRRYHADMPADGKGAKGGDVMTKTHATGSAFTYGQRYLLGMIFNLAVSGKREDDGNAAGGGVITEAQVEELKKLITAAVESKPGTVEVDWLTNFLEWMHVDGLNLIPAKQFNKARAAIIDATQKTGGK